MNFFTSMFTGDDGNVSTMRVMFTLVLVVVIGVWAVLSIKNGQFVHFTAEDLGFLGILFGGKLFQKGFENKDASAETKE